MTLDLQHVDCGPCAEFYTRTFHVLDLLDEIRVLDSEKADLDAATNELRDLIAWAEDELRPAWQVEDDARHHYADLELQARRGA